MASLLIKNGRVVDPASNIDAVRDVLIENGKIKDVKAKIRNSKAKVIDAKGKLVLPGLIDMHTHLRDPGRPDKETIASGTRAAAKGGFTSVCCMANTEPVLDNPALIEYVRTKALSEGVVNVYPIGAVSKGLAGQELVEMGLMVKEGAVAFSDDGKPVMRADIMRRALEYAKQFDLPIIAHCEDADLAHGGAMNEGPLSTKIGLPGLPALAEEIMVARDVMLAEQYGRVHIAHVSSGKSVEVIRRAKKKKAVSCETCPHYFSLTEEAVTNYDPSAKVNPPLKTSKDVQAIIKGLKDGTIDVIATDHAPHNVEEKSVEFNQAAFGLVGLETALALVLTKLVETKCLNLKEAISKLTSNPAKILKLKNKGTLKVGADADVIIVDAKASFQVDPKQFASKSRNTPFKDWQLQGKVLFTIVGGKVVVRDGKLLV